MPQVLSRSSLPSASKRRAPARMDASVVGPDQRLEAFGSWVGDPLWVPPKDASDALAETMFRQSGLFRSRDASWASLLDEHRSDFTQVRELQMCEASIRLPKAKLFVSVTEQEHFDEITDEIPACVQTRLDEFLQGPGKQPGVKVYYLKPLCVEVGNDLIFTTHDDVMKAIHQIQDEVFSAYRSLYLRRLPKRMAVGAFNASLAVPRQVLHYAVERKRKAVNAYHAKLEYQRRKTALRAAKTHRKFRTDGCTYDEMLALTNPLDRRDVIEQFGVVNDLSRAKRERLMWMTAGTIPWFVALSIGISYVSTLTMAAATPVAVCDPAFVAEMPGSKGVVLKIGHFDEVDGVTVVEI